MPLYEYRCTACGHKYEKIQSFSAPEQLECPKCGSTGERLLSAPAIQFKGSGFYLTDYGKAGGSKSGSSEGSGGGKSEGGGSSDAKPSAPKSSGESSAPAAPGSTTPAAAPSSAPTPKPSSSQ